MTPEEISLLKNYVKRSKGYPASIRYPATIYYSAEYRIVAYYPAGYRMIIRKKRRDEMNALKPQSSE
ncbi:hypothetical protein MSG28_015943 [Choristoneura fumiferana]|uniref:Uncharacterized protein n=1 Tax=Choristoneura fumiferana TaxID=7141 RepID=A0ACC0K4U9_CHOFU|nr:hypothetical protein MSG28_015943 [Choristoneura fumiferana]